MLPWESDKFSVSFRKLKNGVIGIACRQDYDYLFEIEQKTFG